MPMFVPKRFFQQQGKVLLSGLLLRSEQTGAQEKLTPAGVVRALSDEVPPEAWPHLPIIDLLKKTLNAANSSGNVFVPEFPQQMQVSGHPNLWLAEHYMAFIKIFMGQYSGFTKAFSDYDQEIEAAIHAAKSGCLDLPPNQRLLVLSSFAPQIRFWVQQLLPVLPSKTFSRVHCSLHLPFDEVEAVIKQPSKLLTNPLWVAPEAVFDLAHNVDVVFVPDESGAIEVADCDGLVDPGICQSKYLLKSYQLTYLGFLPGKQMQPSVDVKGFGDSDPDYPHLTLWFQCRPKFVV